MQVADEEISKVPAWLASIHCADLCLSCHFCGSSGYLLFSHSREIPEALLQNVFSDYKVWSYESGLRCALFESAHVILVWQIVAEGVVGPIVEHRCTDFDGREGVFYHCNATNELNQRVGDIEERVLTFEVRLHRRECASR